MSLILVLFHGNLLSQNYFPMDPGTKWYYTIGKEEVTQVISPPAYAYNGRRYQALVDITPETKLDSTKLDFEGKTFFVYKNGRKGMALDTLFLRKDSLGNIYWFDQHSNSESLYVPYSPKKGKTWKSSDSRFQFDIVSLNDTFRSDSVVFKNCLVISVQPLTHKSDRTRVFHYFYSGFGEVGTKYGDQIIMTLVRKEDGNAR